MQRFFKAFGYGAMLVLGWAWHLLDVLGRTEVAMHLEGIPGAVQRFAAQHQEIGYQIAPWVVMVIGLIGLILMQWPQLLSLKSRKGPPDALMGGTGAMNGQVSVGLLTPYQVLHYMADESKWGVLQSAKQTDEGNTHPLVVASDEFQARAQEGKIRAYGISPETHEHEEIAKTHWMSFRLDYVTALDEQGSESGTQMTGFNGGYYNKAGYTDLRIEASDVYATWPKR